MRIDDGGAEILYVLLSDGDMTMHSHPMPIGVALRDETEAREWARENPWRSFVAVRVFSTRAEAALKIPEVRRRTRAEIAAELRGLRKDRVKRRRMDAGEVVEVPIPPTVAWIEDRIRQVRAEAKR